MVFRAQLRDGTISIYQSIDEYCCVCVCGALGGGDVLQKERGRYLLLLCIYITTTTTTTTSSGSSGGLV